MAAYAQPSMMGVDFDEATAAERLIHDPCEAHELRPDEGLM